MEKKIKEGGCWFLRRKDGKSHPLLRGMMFVGREECDIILQSASADKRHAVIFFDSADEEIRIKDLNSITGTYVNGMRIPEQTYVKLKHLDTLRFGYGPDVFHIERSIGLSLRSFVPKRNVEENLSELFPENQPIIKESNILDDRKMPVEKPTKISSHTKDKPHLQEADSLEDLKNAVPSDSLHDNFQVKNNSSSSLPLINPLKLNRKCSNFFRAPQEDISPIQNSANDTSNRNKMGLETFPMYKTNESIQRLHDVQNNVESQNDEENSKIDHSDKKDTSGDCSPAAMAFTVAFDSCAPRKKLSIKDSISKYAPRKTDAERPSPRLKQEKPVESSIGRVTLPETTAFSESGLKISLLEESTIEDLEDGWKIVNHTENSKKKEGHLSDGATYLIRKMFNGQNKVSPELQVINPLPKSDSSFQWQNNCENISQTSTLPLGTPLSPKSEKESGVDDKSETGTYTIEEDLDDDAVKEARQKIDEVFNVLIPEESNKESECPFSKPTLTRGEHTSVPSSKPLKKGDEASDKEVRCNKITSLVSSVPIRPKRRLPVPPVHTSNINSGTSSDVDKSNYGTYNIKNKDSYVDSMSKSDIILREHSPTSEKSLLTKERLSSNPQTARMLMNNRLSLNMFHSEKISHSVPACEILTENDPQIRTFSSGIQWRRSPWTLSGSDLELDQNRIETSSVLSDVSASTEPPSLATGKKMEHTPLMKFNRAFNLRRARLGLDVEVSNSKNCNVKESQSKNQRSSTLLTPVTTLSRQDGGRFSLRLPKSSSKSGITKGNPKPVNKSAPSPILKVNHRRNDSDPGKTAFLRRDVVKLVNNHQHENLQSSFQRCSSFCADAVGSENELLHSRTTPQKLVKRQDTVTLEKHSLCQKQTFMDYNDSNKPVELDHKNKNHNVKVPEHSNSRIWRNGNDLSGSAKEHSSQYDPTRNKQIFKVAPIPKQKHELSALDSLVISAIHQLSRKLREKAHLLLEKERNKFPLDSTERLTIEEMLPQVSEKRSPDASAEGISRDLSSVLKNLKRVEQSLEVLAAVGDDHLKEQKTPSAQSEFFVVDV